MILESKVVRPRPKMYGVLVVCVAFLTALVAYGTQQVLKEEVSEKPNPGKVQTDPVIQKIADAAVKLGIVRPHARMGFAIVSDPNTGKILAVSNITAEPDADRQGNWALSLLVEPASAMKGLVAALAVEQGLTTLDEVHNCENGLYKFAGHSFGDWGPFSMLSTRDTVVQSSNICGIKVAQKLGAEKLAKGLQDLGIGAGGTAADFPEARPGRIFTPTTGEEAYYVATVGTGYDGIHVTPLEMLQAYGAIANGGNLLKPMLVNDPRPPQVIRRVFSPQTTNKMRDVLVDVTKRGTAASIGKGPYWLAGKTSTAYSKNFYGHATLGGEAHVAGFVGFAPAYHPRVAIYVGIFDPTEADGQAHGSKHAAPVFKQIAEEVLRYYKVPADRS